MKAKKKVNKARLIATQGNYVLVLHSWNGKYTLPGGGKKKKETLIQALIREVEEEVGLRLHPLQLQKWQTKVKEKKLVQVHKHYFLLPQKKGLFPSNKEAHKFISVSWKPWYKVVEKMDKEDKSAIMECFTAIEQSIIN